MIEDEGESCCIDSGRYCIADEMIEAGIKNRGVDFKPCGGSDPLAIYENVAADGEVGYSAYCFSCNQSFSKEQFAASSHAADFGIEGGVVVNKKTFVRPPKATPMTKQEVKTFIRETDPNYEGCGYRNISDETNRFFGHLTKKNKDGIPIARYYPETGEDSGVWPTGYKCRNTPKDFRFGKVGLTGQVSKLSGQVKYEHMNFRDLLLVGGEEDKAAFYQIWNERAKQRKQDDYDGMPIVSGTTGEGSLISQVKAQFDFINKAENIYIGLDNDAAGLAAMEDICAVLPKEKIKIVLWSKKDPNNYIYNTLGEKTASNPKGECKDLSRQAISDFYNAKEYVNSGIFASSGLMVHIKEALRMPRITLPNYMSVLQGMTRGSGIIKNRIYNIIGVTSCGKSTHVNSMVYHFAFIPDETTAVISLEMTKGEYGIDILSLHLETNLYWKEAEEVQEYLDSPEVLAEANRLFVDEQGESRFYVVDDRKGTVRSLEELCEKLRCKYGVTVIVIDVLTDLLRVTSNEEQADHMNWQSNFVKEGVTIFNVLHTRKLQPNKDGVVRKATEYDALGSSIFVQKAAGNFVINRNKEAPKDDWIEKNSTYLDVPKLRQGDTGEGGVWLYDPETRNSYDREQFFIDNPDRLPVGYDLSISSFDRAYYEEGGRGFKGDGSEPSASGGFKKGGFGKKKESKPIPDLMDGIL